MRPSSVIWLVNTAKNFQTQSKSSQTLNNPIKNPISLNEIDQKKLSPAMQMYANKINAKNVEEFNKMKKVKSYNRIVAGLLATFVLGVYGYTMFAISQEKFLDDFDVPEPPDPGYKESVNKNKK